jgi:putative transposase
LVFLDESGFLLQPLRRQTWAPTGQTPSQTPSFSHARITAIAALSRAPWAHRFGLYYELLDHNAKTPDFIRFPREIHQHLRRPMILVWDRLPAHRAAAKLLLESDAEWLRIEWLPAYAPELNPVEDVWSQCKYGNLANTVPDDVRSLHRDIDRVLEHFRHQPNRLHSFFRSAELE